MISKNKILMLSNRLPTLAFNMILDPKNNTLAYPVEWEFTPEKISKFARDYITYSLYDLKWYLFSKISSCRIIYGKEKPVEKSSIYDFLKDVKEFGSNNLTSYINKKSTDLVLLVINSFRDKR